MKKIQLILVGMISYQPANDVVIWKIDEQHAFVAHYTPEQMTTVIPKLERLRSGKYVFMKDVLDYINILHSVIPVECRKECFLEVRGFIPNLKIKLQLERC